MAITGQKRELPVTKDFTKKVGIFEAEVIAINPTVEEYKDILGRELKEDSKATEYLYYKDGVAKVRVDIWLKDVKADKEGVHFIDKVTFFLEDTKRSNKDGSKKQYVNNIGMCSWASSEENLPTWFVKRDYRIAYTGEEELITFLRTWLGNLDFSKEDCQVSLDWKKIIVGNLKEWRDEIGGEWCASVGALATVKTVEKEEGPVSYQNIYNKAFFPGYSIKKMRLVNYNDPTVIRGVSFKSSKELQQHERFVINVTGEYGCKDFYTFKDLQDYDLNSNLVESDKVISEEGSDF
jgi:hypothetical protein